MKEGILIIILGVLILSLNTIHKQLDKLIKLNTPEQINLTAEKYILDIEEMKK